MRIADILLEYDRDRARQALGDKLWKAALRDRLQLWSVFLDDLQAWGQRNGGAKGTSIDRAFQNPLYQKELADAALERIEAADPSTNKKYTQWMARQWIEGHERRLEDVESTMADAMYKFHKLNLKRQLPPPENDINRYKMATFLYQNLDRYDDPDEDTAARGNARKVYEDGEVTVIVPEDEAAACKYGRGTRWCTAATKGQNYFEHYNKDGPLYIIIPKQPHREGEKYQLHFPSGQYMDKDDDPVDIGNLLGDQFPALGKWFLTNPDTADDLKDEVSFASDETLQKISDDIWALVQDVVMDDYSNWEVNDDSFYDWLREQGYVTDDGDIDWDRAPPYEKYNPDAMRWMTDVEEFTHLRPNQLRRAATEAWQHGDYDDRSVYNLESAIAWNVKDKMGRDEIDGEGVANWINKNIVIKRTPEGPKVERVVRRERP